MHDIFKELPPACETLAPQLQWLSDYQLKVDKNVGLINNEKLHGSDKLVPHLFDHQKYVLHYKTCEVLTRTRTTNKQMHKVVPFKRKSWLQLYIY